MAKKVVATLKTGNGKAFTKCIKMVKSEKTSAAHDTSTSPTLSNASNTLFSFRAYFS